MRSQKTLLIIGAGHEQVPAIKMAKEMGHRVVVSDFNPQAPGIEFADHFERVSTKDKDGNLAVAKAQAIEGVMTLGSELAVPVVAYVAEQLGLPSFSSETALRATNKNVMRQSFVAHNVPSPNSERVDSLSAIKTFVAKHGFPVVIKPSDSSGQRGVGVFYQEAELASAFAEAIQFSTDGLAIVETYIEGPEINVTAVVQNGEIEFLSLSHRVTAEPPHFGIALEHRAPAAIDAAMEDSIKQASIKAIEAIGLKNGIAYPQVIASPKGAQVIEIAVRIPGGYMREVALILSGIDMIEVAIRQALSETLPIEAYRKQPPQAAVIVKFFTQLDLPKGTQHLSKVANFEQILTRPGIFLANCRLKAGDKVPELNSSTARFGAIISYGQDLTTAQSYLDDALKTVVIA